MEKTKTCKKRQSKVMKETFYFNEYEMEFEQRMLTLKEVEMMSNYEVDMFEDEDAFSAMMEGQSKFKERSYEDIDESEKDDFVRILHKIQKARDNIKVAQYNYKANFIRFSLMSRNILGGSLKVNGELVKEEKEILEWLEILEDTEFETLYTNVLILTYPSKDELVEVEK